jgi:AcrR family transcriptional regulator
MPRRDPTERILEGLLHAMARHGVGRVSMTDIAHEAGVSRGTLYRYFASQEELLTALGEHVRDEFRTALAKAIAERPEVDERLFVVMSTLRAFNRERPALLRLTETEPGFTIDWFRDNRAHLEEPIREALAPVTGKRTARKRRDLAELTEVVYRVAITYNIAPPDDDESDPAWFAAALAPYLDQA